jgi:hypothetical protein
MMLQIRLCIYLQPTATTAHKIAAIVAANLFNF